MNVTKHQFELVEGAKPVYQQFRRIRPKTRELVDTEIKTMLEEEVIETTESQSHWAFLIIFAPMKEGSILFCVDYRKLNELTK